MFRSTLLFILFLSSTFLRADVPGNSPTLTYESRQDVALDRARKEGKHVFVLFEAKWCTPCRWMERTTLQDEAVRSMLATYFVPLRADIDEGDGFVMFYDHGVEILPTMIILDSQGNMLERIEESLGRDKLLEILRSHSNGLNPVASASTDPQQITSETTSGYSSSTIETQAQEDDADPFRARSSAEESYSAPPANGFTVQAGVFTLYPNVLGKILDIQAIRKDGAIHVEEARINDVVVYKLLSGHFNTRAEAEAWRARLAESGIPGYIRDLRRS